MKKRQTASSILFCYICVNPDQFQGCKRYEIGPSMLSPCISRAW